MARNGGCGNDSRGQLGVLKQVNNVMGEKFRSPVLSQAKA